MSTIVSIDDFIAFGRDLFGGEETDQYQSALDAAEEYAQDFLGRRIEVASGTPSARVFATERAGLYRLRIDDCVSVTSIVDNTVTLATTEYQLEPLNGRLSSGRQVPYNIVRRLGSTWAHSCDGEALCVITADWGWSAIPAAVTEAVLILGKDIYQQRNFTAGTVMSDFGPITTRLNRSALNLLAPFQLVTL